MAAGAHQAAPVVTSTGGARNEGLKVLACCRMEREERGKLGVHARARRLGQECTRAAHATRPAELTRAELTGRRMRRAEETPRQGAKSVASAR